MRLRPRGFTEDEKKPCSVAETRPSASHRRRPSSTGTKTKLSPRVVPADRRLLTLPLTKVEPVGDAEPCAKAPSGMEQDVALNGSMTELSAGALSAVPLQDLPGLVPCIWYMGAWIRF